MSKPKLIELNQLTQFLTDRAIDSVSVFGRPSERARGPTQEPKLFTYDKGTLTVEADDKERDDVRSICERAGLLRQQMEYYPSSLTRPHVLSAQIGVKFDDIDNPQWPGWFNGLVKGKVVVPDTNILLNHTLSVHILPKGVSPTLRLSRISVLELEALACRDKSGNYSSKQSIPRRNSIWAFAEVRTLLDIGADLLPSLEWSTVMNFSGITGRGFADKVIRMELSDFPQSANPTDPFKDISPVLLTRDIINALAAMAENIEAINISASEPDKDSFLISNVDQLSRVLMEALISYSRIILKDAQGNVKMTIDGMWSGKTWYDFYRNRMLIESP